MPVYGVIFIAEINQLDDEYYRAVHRMRELALTEYSCIDIQSVCENNKEITISYWHSEADIKCWHDNPEHREVQQKATLKWYRNYRVQVAEIHRTY